MFTLEIPLLIKIVKGDENDKILVKFQGHENRIDIFAKRILDLTDQD